MMWDNMSNMGWGWIGFGAIHMLLIWVLIILVIVVLIKWIGGKQKDSSKIEQGRTALDILSERYARGEIEREEYVKKKRDLEQ